MSSRSLLRPLLSVAFSPKPRLVLPSSPGIPSPSHPFLAVRPSQGFESSAAPFGAAQAMSKVASAITRGSKSSPKRLIVACDGTWADGDYGIQRDSWWPWSTKVRLQAASNVTRICRALRRETQEDGHAQIVRYGAGVGSHAGFIGQLISGVTGLGISEDIREAYEFLATNYEEGDEIFFLGWSRGAFTARSVAAMINTLGLLTKKGMADFYPIFLDWENQKTPGFKSQWPDTPFPPLRGATERPNAADPTYAQTLHELGLTRLNIPIKAMGVWDTVGTLGIPSLWPWSKTKKLYSFVNEEVLPNVEFAFQALALDEKRTSYTPCLWEKPADQTLPRVLKQCWMPGVHGNVGNSYDDAELGDISLAWMMAQLDGLLEFEDSYISWQHEVNVKYYQRHDVPVRDWSCGYLRNSDTTLISIAGTTIRTPGEYSAVQSYTGKKTDRPLINTNEHVHPSVRVRKTLGGKGFDDVGLYQAAALKDFTLVQSESTELDQQSEGVEKPGYQWVSRRSDGTSVTLNEDTIKGCEMLLLETSPEALEAYNS